MAKSKTRRRPRKRSQRKKHFKTVRIVESCSAALSRSRQSNDEILVVDRNGWRAAYLQCPCGCNEVVVLNLDMRLGPAWEVADTAAGGSIVPSIVRETGCKSHFIVWEGHVLWCRYRQPTIDRNWPDTLQQALDQWLSK